MVPVEEEDEDIGEPGDYKYEEAALVAAIVVANSPLATFDGSEAFVCSAAVGTEKGQGKRKGKDDFVLLPDTKPKPAEFRKNVSMVLGYEESDSVYFVAAEPSRSEKGEGEEE